MIQHLRQLRRQLVENSKIKKYIFYAVGEILLVVFGILIALYINTLNNQKNARILERSTLGEISNSLNSDIDKYNKQIEQQLILGDDSKILLDHLNAGLPYHEKLDTLWERAVRYFLIDFNNSAFSLLENRGIDLIRNETLRNQIVHHFNYEQANLKRRFEITQHNSNAFMLYTFDRVQPVITDNFRNEFDYSAEVLIPVDYQLILKDATLISKISHTIKIRVRMSQMLREFINKQKKLRELIELEIESLSF